MKKQWDMQSIIDKGLTVTGGAGKLIDLKPEEKLTKYRNKKTLVDGILFDSAKEGARYVELKALERYRQIENLRLQVEFDLAVNGHKVCRYVADFVYTRDGKQVVEDVKSEATKKNRAYRIKNKLMRAVHGITIIEI